MSSILMITRYFPPLDSIATARMYSWAKYLERKGNTLTILTTSKEKQFVTPLKLDVSSFEVIELNYFDPINALGFDKREESFSSGKLGKFSLIQKFYRERLNERLPGRTDLWIFSAVKKLKELKKQGRHFDSIISSYGPPSAHIVGRFAKKIFGSTWIADYRDLWIENHIYKGLFPFTLAEKAIEKKTVGHADMITTVSPALKEVLEKKFPTIPCYLIENGFDPEQMDQAEKGYFQEEKFRIIFTGTIYRSRSNLMPLFQALHELLKEGVIHKENFEVLIFGRCPDDIEKLIYRYSLSHVVKQKRVVSLPEAHRIQKSANVLLFVEHPNPVIDGILTGKLFEYLYSQVPILAVGISPQSAPAKIILETRSGVVIESDVKVLKETIVQMYQGKFSYQQDKESILGYSRKVQAEKINSYLNFQPKVLPNCSVIVKTHNSEKFIHKVIRCLDDQSVRPEKVVIVDSASKDPSYLNIYRERADIELIVTEEDIGFCKGNNIGLPKIAEESRYILFLNPDAFLTPNVIEEAIRFMECPENKRVAVVTGVLHGFDIDQNCSTNKYDSTGIFQRWYGRWYDRDQGRSKSSLSSSKNQKVPAICGAFMFCRKEAIDEVLIGGEQVFDNSFFMYKEDVDLSLRLREKGWSLVLKPDIIVYHCRGWKRRSLIPRKHRLCAAWNEVRIHGRVKSPYVLYSMIKYFFVKAFNF